MINHRQLGGSSCLWINEFRSSPSMYVRRKHGDFLALIVRERLNPFPYPSRSIVAIARPSEPRIVNNGEVQHGYDDGGEYDVGTG